MPSNLACVDDHHHHRCTGSRRARQHDNARSRPAQVHLGFYEREEQAAAAYDRAAINKGAKDGAKIVTNFDFDDYLAEIPMLFHLSQDELVSALGSERCGAPGERARMHAVVCGAPLKACVRNKHLAYQYQHSGHPCRCAGTAVILPVAARNLQADRAPRDACGLSVRRAGRALRGAGARGAQQAQADDGDAGGRVRRARGRDLRVRAHVRRRRGALHRGAARQGRARAAQADRQEPALRAPGRAAVRARAADPNPVPVALRERQQEGLQAGA